MAFWEKPPQYMLERERRLLGQLEKDSDDEKQSSLASIEEAVESTNNMCIEEDDEDVERSNMRFRAKEKLKELSKYVSGHVYRKIRAKWPKIKELFIKEVPVENTKRGALTRSMSIRKVKTTVGVSSIMALFCSPEINNTMDDTIRVFEEIGLSRTSIDVACRICAFKIEADLFDDMDVNFIHQIGEEMMTEEQMIASLFSHDPVKQASEFALAEDDYRVLVNERLEKVRKLKAITDKALARTERNIELFARSSGELQNSRGPVSYRGPRLNKLYRMGAALTKAFFDDRIRSAMDVIAHHRNMLHLFGADKFSNRYVQFVMHPVFGGSREWELLESADDMPAHFFHRVKLSGTPTLLSSCRLLISQGKGLDGMSYNEVVELVQALAATLVQTVFRMHRKHAPFCRARQLWRTKHHDWKWIHFSAWKAFTHMINLLRRHCRRKIIAWKFFTKKNLIRRKLFCICFWPIYVWRRYAIASAKANQKTKFLIGRVYPCYLLLHHFRGWKRVAKYSIFNKKRGDDYHKSRLLMKKFECFNWIREWTQSVKDMRHSDVKTALYTVQKRILMKKLSFFQLWRGYMMYRRAVKQRVMKYAPDFRRALMKTFPPKNSYESYRQRHIEAAERKEYLRVKAAEEESRKEEKRRRKAMKYESSHCGGSASAFRRAMISDSINKSNSDDSDDDTLSKDDDYEDDVGAELSNDSDFTNAPFAEIISYNTGETKIMSTWRTVRPPEAYDIFNVDEESYDAPEDVPASILQLYLETRISLEDELHDELLHSYSSRFVKDKFSVLQQKFQSVEILSLLEESMVYHRVASKAFRNLEINSIVNKNGRKAILKYQLKLMRKVFQALYDWMHSIDVGEKSDAEKLALEARAARLAILEKRRLLQKNVLESRKMFDDDSIKSVDSKEVDLLELDRDERSEEIRHLKRMIAMSDGYQQHSINLAVKNDHDLGRKAHDLKLASINEIFQCEGKSILIAKDTEMSYAESWKVNAAQAIVNTFYRVYEGAMLKHLLWIARIFFRHLRMPLLKKRSTCMRNRAILKNYIRICKRLTSLGASVHKYQSKRKMWVSFNRWLKLLEISYLETTPGLITNLKRSARMYRCFSLNLKEAGFSLMNFCAHMADESLVCYIVEFRQLFLRWKMHTQESKLLRLAEETAGIIYIEKLIKKVFLGLKYFRRTFVIPKLPHEVLHPVLLRAVMDLDQIIQRFIAFRKTDLYLNFRYLKLQSVYKISSVAKKTFTFKGFIAAFNNEIGRRLSSEMTVLADAFEDRGSLVFVDRSFNNGVPESMLRVPGFEFTDPLMLTDDDKSNLPGGYLLSSITICMQESYGVAGIQLIWRGDSAPDIIGKRRGKWNGAAQSIQQFSIPNDDFVKGIEYYYEGSAIYGMRLLMYFGGWTSWIGSKNSMSTLTMYLDVDFCPLPVSEDEMLDSFSDDPNLAFKKRYIIGLTGIESSFHATGLGIIVRNVTHQHIFSYHWVNEAMERDANNAEVRQRQEKMKKERGSNLNRRLKGRRHGGKTSLPAIIQAQIISKLSRNSKWSQGVAESIALASSQLFSNSLEQYLDCTRMRTKEIQSALHRAKDFAIRMWADRSILKNEELTPLINLRIISGLTRWFYEIISKNLIPDFKLSSVGTEMILESMRVHNKADADMRGSAMASANVNKLEREMRKKHWENKYLMSPEDRKLKKEFEQEMESKRKEALDMLNDADKRDHAAFEMFKRGKSLLPCLQLTIFVCNNYRIKIEAARHKSVLLERMTMNEVKASLNGASERASNVLTRESLNILQNSLIDCSQKTLLTPLGKDVEDSIVDECKQVVAGVVDNKSLTYEKSTIRSRVRSIPNPVDISRPRVHRAHKVLVRSSTDELLRLYQKRDQKLPPLALSSVQVNTNVAEPITDEM